MICFLCCLNYTVLYWLQLLFPIKPVEHKDTKEIVLKCSNCFNKIFISLLFFASLSIISIDFIFYMLLVPKYSQRDFAAAQLAFCPVPFGTSLENLALALSFPCAAIWLQIGVTCGRLVVVPLTLSYASLAGAMMYKREREREQASSVCLLSQYCAYALCD